MKSTKLIASINRFIV